MKRDYNQSNDIDNIISLFDRLLNVDESVTDNKGYETDTDSEQILITLENEIIKIDPDMEWKKLNENIQKLNYFKSVMSKVNIHNKFFFEKALRIFMDKIDSINQYYLKVISFDINTYTDNNGFNIYDLDTIKEMVSVIYESINESLNCNDTLTKLDFVLKAYSNLILLGADVRHSYNNNITTKKARIFH
jgi:hypothetical protein